jgi:hypothetical protein
VGLDKYIMETTLIIVDNFYSNPFEVVTYMKQQQFHKNLGNHPGVRTVGDKNPGVKQTIQDLVFQAGGLITEWDDLEFNGSFNCCNQQDRSWIHADMQSWAGVVYLTPDAPPEAGTGIYKHKATGLYKAPRMLDGSIDYELQELIYRDSQDMTKWELIDYVGNKFNRLVMYRGDLFHSAVNYFGRDFSDSRYHQTFFFSTER